MYSMITDGYYLQGEVDKWIAVSRQRFKEITYMESGEIYVRIVGAVGETVNIAFIQYPELEQVIVSCTFGETQQLSIRMPAEKCTPY